jgi:hypothetical protein
MKHTLSGFYNLIVRDGATLEAKRESGWFPNLITDIGLNRIGSGGIATHGLVGSGSAAPSFTDSAMNSFVAAAANDGSGADALNGAQSTTAPYYGWHRRSYRFPMGVAAGNLSEVGVGWHNGSGYSAFARTLIKDINGDPTTMTVLSDEVLDVVYELRLYPPATDSNFTFNIGGVTHSVVRRAAIINDANAWTPKPLFNAGLASNGYKMRLWSGAIGTIFQLPAGSVGESETTVRQSYSNNSLVMQYVSLWGLAFGNVGGANSIDISPQINSGGVGHYQMSVSPTIAKDATKTLALTFELTWARKT